MRLIIGIGISTGVGPDRIHERYDGKLALRPVLESSGGRPVMARHPLTACQAALLRNEADLTLLDAAVVTGKIHEHKRAVERTVVFDFRGRAAELADECPCAHATRRFCRCNATLDIAVDIEIPERFQGGVDRRRRKQTLDVVLDGVCLTFGKQREVLCELLGNQEKAIAFIVRRGHPKSLRGRASAADPFA